MMMKVATYYPTPTKKFDTLLQEATTGVLAVQNSGIQQVHTCEIGISSTALAVSAYQQLAEKHSVIPTDIDCVAWIAEGVDDFIYMDTAKTFIEDIEGNTDGEIHTYQLYGGAGGTIQAIQLICNQLIANPSVDTAVIVTALLWESHSADRFLHPTYMGDGAGVLWLTDAPLLQKMILGIKITTIDACHTAHAIPYGGTKHPITQQVVQQQTFKLDTISPAQQNMILDTIIQEASMLINDLCDTTNFDIHKIDYIGIAGFHQQYSQELLKILPDRKVIDPLPTKGYLGSLGVFEILNQFLNTSAIISGTTLLLINLGLEGNIETMLLEKP